MCYRICYELTSSRELHGKKRNALSTCDISQYSYASVCLRIAFDVPLDKDRHAGLGTDT